MKSIKLLLAISIVFFSNILTSQTMNLEEGIREYKLGNNQAAASYFGSRIVQNTRKNKSRSDLLFWYAKTLFQGTDIKTGDVITMLNEVLDIDPNNNDALYFRTRLLHKESGLTDNVKRSYKELLDSYELSTDQRNISAYLLKGYEATYKEYMVLDHEKGAEYYYSLAAIMSFLDKPMQAVKNLNKSLEMRYSNYDFLILDFYNCRHKVGIYNLLNSFDVPPSFYVQHYKEEKKSLTIETAVKVFVENKINFWQKKGKFEKTSDYLKRVTPESHLEKVEYYTQVALDSIGMSKMNWNDITNEYDADNESFMIIFQDIEPIFINVPISEAPSFDANFKDLEFNDINFTISSGMDLSILQISVSNPSNGKAYLYNSKDEIAYTPTQMEFNFDEIDVPLENLSQNKRRQNTAITTKVISVGKSDVDTDIPITNTNNTNTYALIIGNEDYTKFQNDLNSEVNVDYAKRDAEIFAQYAEKALGIPKGNITLLTDAISSQMNREIEKLSKLAKYSEGEASIIFYYAGHGFPDEKTKEAYIMPVDISGAFVQDGIKINDLYSKLTLFPSKRIVVLLDACFSGGGRNQGLLAARGVAIKPKPNNISGNLVVFSSSTAEQSSLPYKNKQHGMFTYFLLKKLKESKGDITLEELSDYVTKEVQISALKINSKEQNPNILISPDVGNLWMDWKLN